MAFQSQHHEKRCCCHCEGRDVPQRGPGCVKESFTLRTSQLFQILAWLLRVQGKPYCPVLQPPLPGPVDCQQECNALTSILAGTNSKTYWYWTHATHRSLSCNFPIGTIQLHRSMPFGFGYSEESYWDVGCCSNSPLNSFVKVTKPTYLA